MTQHNVANELVPEPGEEVLEDLLPRLNDLQTNALLTLGKDPTVLNVIIIMCSEDRQELSEQIITDARIKYSVEVPSLLMCLQI